MSYSIMCRIETDWVINGGDGYCCYCCCRWCRRRYRRRQRDAESGGSNGDVDAAAVPRTVELHGLAGAAAAPPSQQLELGGPARANHASAEIVEMHTSPSGLPALIVMGADDAEAGASSSNGNVDVDVAAAPRAVELHGLAAVETTANTPLPTTSTTTPTQQMASADTNLWQERRRACLTPRAR